MADDRMMEFVERSRQMIRNDTELREIQEGMERMVHLEYDLPEGLRSLDWMRNVRVTAPYDAFKASRKILSGLDEQITLFPFSESEEDQRRANEIEHILRWNWNQAAGRQASFREDIIGSAVLYDRIFAQVIHLPTQIKALDAIGADTKRQEAALRHGPFAIILHNPKNVHVTYSHYMLEEVLLVQTMSARQALYFWGEGNLPEVTQAVRENPEHATETYVFYDFHSLDERMVMYALGDNAQVIEEGSVKKLMGPIKNKYPFMPWVGVVGGNAIDDDPKYRSQPLLFPVYQAEQWVTANIMASLATSQEIAEFARPKVKIVGPSADRVRAEYGQPGGAWRSNDPNTDVVDMVERRFNPSAAEAWDRFVEAMHTTTLPRVLISAEPQAGEAFAGFNLRLQTALGHLLPFKRLAERFVEGIMTHMMLWTHYTGEEMIGYEVQNGRPSGKRLKLDSEDIEPERIHLRVELSPDVPTDRVQRITAAINMAERLHVPVTHVLGELGITDPQAALRQWAREQVRFAILQGKLTEIQDSVSGRMQQRALQMAQQILAEQQMGEGGGASPNGRGPGEQPDLQSQLSPEGESLGEGGIMGLEGGGFNPAAGETPPATASPEGATREAQSGTTGLGGDIAELLNAF